MSKKFNNLLEMQKYYDEKTNTYVFTQYDLVVFDFNLDVEANIKARNIDVYNIKTHNIDAYDINACNIDAYNITANDINASDVDAMDVNARNVFAYDINVRNIKANDISYYAICYAYNNIVCNSIMGRRNNSKHFVLDGELKINKEVLENVK